MAEGGHDLIIGIGNPMRGDDGVGWWLAERAERLQRAPQGEAVQEGPPVPGLRRDVQVRTVQQLTPELAEELKTARRVLFLDACWPAAIADGLDQAHPPQGASLQVPIITTAAQLSEPIKAPLAGHEATVHGRPAGGRHAAESLFRPAPPDLPSLRRLAVGDGRGEIGAFSHRLDPAQLLAITALLHGRAPQAWILLVPAWAMPHGARFSVPLQRLLPQAEALLQGWCAAHPDHA